MEPFDVETYLEQLGPALRLQLCKTMPDDDVYQQASLDIYRDCQRYVCRTGKDFIKLFCRYFLTIRSRNRWNLQCESEHHKHYSLEEYRDSMGSYQLNHYANDPRDDIHTEVKEYIGLLPKAYRRTFECIFIEGMTYEETGRHLELATMRIHQLVREGVKWIQDEIKEMEKE